VYTKQSSSMFQEIKSSESITSSDIQQKAVFSLYRLSDSSSRVCVITGGEKSWSMVSVYQEVVMFVKVVTVLPGTQSDIREDVSVGVLMFDGSGSTKSPPPGGLMHQTVSDFRQLQRGNGRSTYETQSVLPTIDSRLSQLSCMVGFQPRSCTNPNDCPWYIL
jgi:hypothetical protein